MNARLPDWADLQIFLATARAGTLSGAGGTLGVNASTVHRRLQRLEGDLGARLFDRSQRGYALTTAGERLFEHALRMEHEVEALGRTVGGLDETIEGTVQVTTVEDFAHLVLMPVLPTFAARHPAVTVEVTIDSGFRDLSRREADVAIRFGGTPSDPDVIAKRLATVRSAIYASPRYLAAHGTPRHHEDLHDHPVVRADARLAAYAMERFMDQHGGPTVLRSNSFFARGAAIKSGLGLGFLSLFAGEPDPELVRVDVPIPDVTVGIWLIIHADLRRNARVRAFVDFAFDALRERFDLLEAGG